MKLPLKKLREQRKMTQAELGRRLSIAPSTVGMWEQGYRNPDYDNLKRLSQLFGVTIDYLLDNENASAGTLSEDETRLICDYRLLDDESKRLVQSMARRLPTAGNHVVQSNRNGNNYYNAAGIQVNA